MEPSQTLLLALPWALVVLQACLIYLLLRRHGRALLVQEELRARLAGLERADEEGEARPAEAARPPADDTLVAASVTTVYMEALRQRWRAEAAAMVLDRPLPVFDDALGMAAEGQPPPAVVLQARRPDVRVLPSGEVGPVRPDEAPEAGVFAVYDWRAREIVWQRGWGPLLVEPSGFCFADGFLYLADSAGGGILRIDLADQPGRPLRRISHPSFNDLHSVARTRRGLLVASTGVDAILEVSLEGDLLYEWWAGDHGYTMTPAGRDRPSGRGGEHRDQYYHTSFHATHVNEAVVRDPGERLILAVFWTQGQVVQIDRGKPAAEQQPEVVLDGLSRPHGLKRTPSGWIVCSSLSGEILLLDEALRVADRIAYASNWIQDCLMLPSGRILLNDGLHHRIVELGGTPWRVESVTPYPRNWRVGRLLEVPPAYRAAFQRIAAVEHATMERR